MPGNAAAIPCRKSIPCGYCIAYLVAFDTTLSSLRSTSMHQTPNAAYIIVQGMYSSCLGLTFVHR